MSVRRPYKIVFCTPALYSAGGVERMVSVKANYFAEAFGYDVSIIITEGNDNASFFPISNNVKIINLQIDFEELWNIGFIRKIYLYLIKQRRYKRLLTKELMRIRPDFTISTLRREVNFISQINDGSIKIGELHLNRANFRTLERNRKNIFKGLFIKWWKNNLVKHLKGLDKFVVLTENSLKEWPELDNVVMIPDSLPISEMQKSSLTAKRVVTIGRYSHEKGYDNLLRAWSIVEKKIPDWCLDIYGMGDSKPYMQYLKELNIDGSRCHLNGSVKDVQEIYKNCSVFVLSSRFEGFGLVLVEAMASGVPVVSFNCPSGPIELIEDGVNGLLAPSGDIDGLVEKLVKIINDYNLRQRLSVNGVKTSQLYSIDIVADRWKNLFVELISAK